jgi:hypothetical protein
MVPTQSPRTTTSPRPRKAAATAAPSRRKAKAEPGNGGLTVDPNDRDRYIAEAAYYIAERRGFSGGMELDDWLEAEVQISRLFSPH